MDVIIVGAGAAGLMAAKILSQGGKKVCVLEAHDRIGGRIHTITNSDFGRHYEAGAEFIHGNLPVTLQLLKEAGLEAEELAGDVWEVINGEWKQENAFFKQADVVIERLKALPHDMSIADFMNRYLNEEKYESLRAALTSYVEGYYSGEVGRISAKSFVEEWLSEDEQQYRPATGYKKMLDYLVHVSKKNGTQVQLSTVVKKVKWQAGTVEITDSQGRVYSAKQALITVPLGVLTAPENSVGAIEFTPALPAKKLAAQQMGFGDVIKILLAFKTPFWEEAAMLQKAHKNTANFHMILANSSIPTWWTQLPNHVPLLTGWLSGPQVAQMKDKPTHEMVKEALNSVSAILPLSPKILQENLVWAKVFNWSADPFTRGSYSYSTLHTKNARTILLEPIENTLYFAGEALYDGPEMGTVEAALTSGRQVANNM